MNRCAFVLVLLSFTMANASAVVVPASIEELSLPSQNDLPATDLKSTLEECHRLLLSMLQQQERVRLQLLDLSKKLDEVQEIQKTSRGSR